MVIQAGISLAKRWKLPTTFVNQIHEKAIAVKLGLFMTPGSVPATSPSTMERSNRIALTNRGIQQTGASAGCHDR